MDKKIFYSGFVSMNSYFVLSCFMALLLVYSPLGFSKEGNSNTNSSSITNNVVSSLVKCLAQEELLIHQRKVTGPVYQINADLLNEFVTRENLEIKKEYLSVICSFKEFSPSIQLLKHLLIYGKIIFIDENIQKKKSGNDLLKFYFQQSVIDSLIERTPELFLTYISGLQSLTTRSGCLEEEIPELKEYLLQYKHHEDESDASSFLFDKKKIEKIFNRLLQFDQLYGKCEYKQKREKEREKLKEKERINNEKKK